MDPRSRAVRNGRRAVAVIASAGLGTTVAVTSVLGVQAALAATPPDTGAADPATSTTSAQAPPTSTVPPVTRSATKAAPERPAVTRGTGRSQTRSGGS